MSIKEFIKQALDKHAAQEPAFALKLQNKSKSIDQCVKYIYGEVLHKHVTERRGVQAAAIERDEVVGMAIHYYDEENVTIRPLSGVAGVRASGSVRNTSNSKPKAADKETVATAAKVAENAPKRKTEDKPKKQPKAAKNVSIEDDFFGCLFGPEDFMQ